MADWAWVKSTDPCSSPGSWPTPPSPLRGGGSRDTSSYSLLLLQQHPARVNPNTTNSALPAPLLVAPAASLWLPSCDVALPYIPLLMFGLSKLAVYLSPSLPWSIPSCYPYHIVPPVPHPRGSTTPSTGFGGCCGLSDSGGVQLGLCPHCGTGKGHTCFLPINQKEPAA